MPDKDPAANGWHIDRRLNLGNIMAIVVLAGSIFLYLTALDKQIALNAQAIKHTNETMLEVKDVLRNLNHKLNDFDRPTFDP